MQPNAAWLKQGAELLSHSTVKAVRLPEGKHRYLLNIGTYGLLFRFLFLTNVPKQERQQKHSN